MFVANGPVDGLCLDSCQGSQDKVPVAWDIARIMRTLTPARPMQAVGCLGKWRSDAPYRVALFPAVIEWQWQWQWQYRRISCSCACSEALFGVGVYAGPRVGLPWHRGVSYYDITAVTTSYSCMAVLKRAWQAQI